jgi:ABC-2 type transport system permease protein/oleandomycin transport system permease protein
VTAVSTSSRLPVRAALGDALVVARRFVLQLLRTPQLIMFAIVQQVLFLLLFRYVFGGSIQIPGLSYVDFIVPAFLTQVAIYDGFGIAVGLAEDAKSGLVERFRALPMARSAFVTGRAASDLLRQAVLLVIVTAVSFAVGFGFHSDAGSIAAGFGLALVFGFALFWPFAWVGLTVRNVETAQAATMPVFLLGFISTAFIQVDTLPGWLQPFARNQPVSQVTNALRGLMEGRPAELLVEHSTGHYVLTSLLWSAAIIAVFVPLAIRAYRKV